MATQHAVIVGGSSGIGLASAQHLLAAGIRVTIAGRDANRLAEAKRQLGPQVETLVMDAADTASLPARFERIGRFDHLILALGSGKGVGPFASVALDDVKQGFEEKVFAHFGTAQAALPFLSPSGSITFVSAVSAQAAVPGTAGIGAANAAIAALVPILAVELKPLRVNGVSPGVIDTPWWDAFTEEQRQGAFKDFAAKTPVGRVGRPEDVAKAITYLVDNDFITGDTLIIDGGLRFTASV